jgi:hypothetical protein
MKRSHAVGAHALEAVEVVGRGTERHRVELAPLVRIAPELHESDASSARAAHTRKHACAAHER